MTTSLLKDFIGAGLFADLPDPTVLGPTIPAGMMAAYFATDTNQRFFLAGGDTAWQEDTAGGGGGTPTTRPAVRASSSMSGGGTANLNWPAGTVAGDTVFLFYMGGYNLVYPAGWEVVDAEYVDVTNSVILKRVLDAGDISTGHLTVVTGGGYRYIATLVTITGAIGSIYSIKGDLLSYANAAAYAAGVTFRSPECPEECLMLAHLAIRSNFTGGIGEGTNLTGESHADGAQRVNSIIPADGNGVPVTITASTFSGDSGNQSGYLQRLIIRGV